MAFERAWPSVSPQAFTVDGGQFGLVTVADTAGFKVKQSAYLTKSDTPTAPLAVQVKRVISPTKLIVGKIDNKIAQWTPLDISAYTMVLSASIGAEEQPKNRIGTDDILPAVYEGDPAVALRTIFVDQYGQFYDASNPLPIVFEGTISVGTITNFPNPVDTNYGVVGASTIRTAAQIGNASGSAAFGAGTTTAQVLRVVLPTDQTAIPVTQSGSWIVAATQSGAWTTGRTWTLSNSTDSISAVQGTAASPSGAWPVKPTDGTHSQVFSANSDGRVSDTINTSSVNGAISVTSTPSQAQVSGSPLANRKLIVVTPTNGTVYWGSSVSVSTANGSPIFKNQSVSFSFSDIVPIWLVAVGTVDVRIVEGS